MDTRLVNPHDCQYVQSRVTLDMFAVAEYEEMMEHEVLFDPCKGILCDDGAIVIYDGNHRAEAAKGNGMLLQVDLTPGTASDAEWLAASANTRHGLRRSPGDIEKSVKATLRHPNAQGRSDRDIARHCGCDHKTVGKYRKELEASGERPQMLTKTVTRNGTEYQMTIPMPEEPETEPESVRDVSPRVFVDREFEHYRQKYAPGPGHVSTVLTGKDIQPVTKHGKQGAYVHRHQPKPWGCTRCLKNHPLGGWGFFYEHGAQVCPMCIDEYDPCAICKQARGNTCADDCCELCKHPCNGQQRCRLTIIAHADAAIDEGEALIAHTDRMLQVSEPEQATHHTLGQCYFCDDMLPVEQLYSSYNKHQCIRGHICRTCAQKALHELLDPDAADVLRESQRSEDFSFYSRDCDKIMRSGLRLFRVDTQEKMIKEYTPVNSTSMEGVNMENYGSWKHFEKFDTKKALKERIVELEDNPTHIFENHL